MLFTVPAAALPRIRALLKRGGAIVYPTESCFGLGVDPRNARAVRRAIALKKRSSAKGLIVIADSPKRLEGLIRPLDAADMARLTRSWPARTTYLLSANPLTHPLLRGPGRGKIAVRVPSHPGARSLCAQLGMPLVSTSANRSGRRSAKTAREARRAFGSKAMLLKGRCQGFKSPSAIIDWDSKKRLR